MSKTALAPSGSNPRTTCNPGVAAETAFVDIVHLLVDDFDVIDVLTQLTTRAVDLLHASAAGILLADEGDNLRVVAASSEESRLLELFQMQNDQGPSLDCYYAGKVVVAADLTTPSAWPEFAARSLTGGYSAVCAIPLRHDKATLGCLNLFMADSRLLTPSDIARAQGLADFASLAIVHSDANRHSDGRVARLHHALGSRIAVEQATGMIAEEFAIDAHLAFEMLVSNATHSDRSLTATAEQIVSGCTALAEFELPPSLDEVCELGVVSTVEGRRRIVRFTGELDLGTKVACFNACVNGPGDSIEIDISGITFIDCSGYGALVAARVVLERRHATMSLTAASGQPAQLLGVITDIENANWLPYVRVAGAGRPNP